MAGPWGASGNTEDILLGVGFGEDLIAILNWLLRSAGHMAAYALFAWLVLRAFRGGRATTRRHALLALAFAVLLASVDETIQSIVPSRTGKVTDVILDGVGASIALVFALRRAARRRGPAPSGDSAES